MSMRRSPSASASIPQQHAWPAFDLQPMEMLQYVARWLPESWSGLGDLAPPFDAALHRAAAGWIVRADRMLGKLATVVLLVAIVHYALTLAHARAAVADFHPLNGDFQ